MIVTVTFKLTAESKEELVQVFAEEVTEYRTAVEEARKQGLFGDPSKVVLRWMAIYSSCSPGS